MKPKSTNIILQNKNIILITLVVAFLLLLPLAAMQITDKVSWDITDFIAAGALLFGTGLAYELVTRKGDTIVYRAAMAVALLAALLLVWVNLAVGIIGSEENPANLMYIGVLAIGLIGALIVRFRPGGMARVLFATALAQAIVPVIALIIGKLQITSRQELGYVLVVMAVNAFFVALWLGSAWLFRRASAIQN